MIFRGNRKVAPLIYKLLLDFELQLIYNIC